MKITISVTCDDITREVSTDIAEPITGGTIHVAGMAAENLAAEAIREVLDKVEERLPS